VATSQLPDEIVADANAVLSAVIGGRARLVLIEELGVGNDQTRADELGYTIDALMTKADLYRLVDDLPDDAVEDTAVLLKRITLRQLDPAQAWVWTDQWQEQLRGSFADLEAGRIQRFDNGEEFLAAL
jgi:hypothetical protein